MLILTYLSERDEAWPTEDLVGDQPLFNAHDVSVRIRPDGELRVVVTGAMRKIDGGQGRNSRCSVIDLVADQPDWLAQIIADALARLTWGTRWDS